MNFDIKIEENPIDYSVALEIMQNRKQQIILKQQKSLFWLLEHNDIYTAGKSAKNSDLLNKSVNTILVDRGGQWTYHGHGQVVGYIVANLSEFNNGILDIRKFINCVEKTIINTLKHFNIEAFADKDNIGIWVNNDKNKQKIGSIGVKIGQMVTTHGFALNVTTDLEKFKEIVPCGIKEYPLCSMESLGYKVSVNDVKNILEKEFKNIFCL